MQELIGSGFALFTALAFAASNVAVRRGVHSVRAAMLVIGFTRVALLLPIVVVSAMLNGWPQGSAFGIWWFVAAGMGAPLIGQSALMASIARIGAPQGAAVKNAAPAVTVLLAFLLLGETMSRMGIGGMLLVFVGLSVLIASLWRAEEAHRGAPDATALEADPQAGVLAFQAPSWRRRRAMGLTFAFLAAIGFGLGQLLRKVAMNHLPDAWLGALIGSLAALVSIVAMAGIGGSLRPQLAEARASANRWMIAAGVLATVGQVCFFLALNYIEVSRVALITASDVVLTTLLAAVILRDYERVTGPVIAASVLIFLGVAAVAMG